MKKYLKYTLLIAATVLSGTAFAQNLSSAYFLDGFAYGHQLNPAKEYDRSGYFSLPFLPSNMNLGLKGNLNLKDVLFQNPNGNGLVTYLHPSLSTSEALKGFSANNKLLTDLRWDLFSFGFHAFKGYNTVTMGVRANVGMNLPYEIFDLTKNLTNKDYNVSDLGATASAWTEVALGHSHNVAKGVRIGVKAKVMLGVGYADLKMNNLDLNLTNTDRWTAMANATAEVGVKGFSWGETVTKEYNSKKNPDGTPATYEQIEFDNIDVDGLGLNGFGLGVDLGAEVDLGEMGVVDGLKLSASVLDIGYIKWNNVAVAQNCGEEFVFEGFNNINVDGENGMDFDDQIDDLGDRLSDLYSLQSGGVTSKKRSMGATLNIGVEYALPFYDKLSFGFLSTSRINGVYSWNEERISATISPCKMLEFSTNVAFGTLGTNVGWILNFHPRAFNLFIGSDHCVGKLSKQLIPLRSNYDFTMGINFPIGKSRVK